MTYDNTENAYLITSGNGIYRTIFNDNLNVSNTRSIQADFKLKSGTNLQGALGLFNGTNGVISRVIKSNVGYFTIDEGTTTSDGTNKTLANPTINLNTWYTVKITYNGTSVTAQLISNNTVIQTLTTTSSVLSASSNKLGLWVGFDGNPQFYVKNIIVE